MTEHTEATQKEKARRIKAEILRTQQEYLEMFGEKYANLLDELRSAVRDQSKDEKN